MSEGLGHPCSRTCGAGLCLLDWVPSREACILVVSWFGSKVPLPCGHDSWPLLPSSLVALQGILATLP